MFCTGACMKVLFWDVHRKFLYEDLMILLAPLYRSVRRVLLLQLQSCLTSSITTAACIWHIGFLPSTLFGVSCRCNFDLASRNIRWVKNLSGCMGRQMRRDLLATFKCLNPLRQRSKQPVSDCFPKQHVQFSCKCERLGSDQDAPSGARFFDCKFSCKQPLARCPCASHGRHSCVSSDGFVFLTHHARFGTTSMLFRLFWSLELCFAWQAWHRTRFHPCGRVGGCCALPKNSASVGQNQG